MLTRFGAFEIVVLMLVATSCVVAIIVALAGVFR